MKRAISENRANALRCPPVCGTRPEPDVAILLESARKDGYGKSWSDILNTCARAVLTPLYGGKRVAGIQEKLGVKEQ